MRYRVFAAGLTAVAVACGGGSPGHDEKQGMKAAVHPPDGIRWADGPPSLPAGA